MGMAEARRRFIHRCFHSSSLRAVFALIVLAFPPRNDDLTADALSTTANRCDRPLPLGVNLTSLTKVLKCAKDDDQVTLKAADEADVLTLLYESRSTCFPASSS